MSARLKLAEVIGTVFYIGKMPFAPGTWGSLAALISWYLLKPSMIDPLFLLITGGIFFIGIAVSAILTKEWQQKDPKEIVIDEWVGMWIALYLCPHDFKWGLVSFLFFRIFLSLKVKIYCSRISKIAELSLFSSTKLKALFKSL